MAVKTALELPTLEKSIKMLIYTRVESKRNLGHQWLVCFLFYYDPQSERWRCVLVYKQ